MDAKRFDAITKAWTTLPRTRRRVLGSVATGVLGSLLGRGVRDASAQVLACRKSRQCPKRQVCVHGFCAPKCGDPFTCGGGAGSGGVRGPAASAARSPVAAASACLASSVAASRPAGNCVTARTGASVPAAAAAQASPRLSAS